MNSIISAEWLKSQWGSDDLVIIDVSPTSTVSSMQPLHLGQVIKGSVFADIKQKFTNLENIFPNAIPSADRFQLECRKLGINNKSRIVVYDNLGVYASPRMWYLFQVMGHQNVAVLNGGLDAWIKADGETAMVHRTTELDGDFVARYDDSTFLDYHDIKANIESGTRLLIDARAKGRFSGNSPEPRANLKSGSIPQSINLPYKRVLENGKFLPKEQLIKIFGDVVNDEKDLIFSCGSGMTACIILLACRQVLSNNTFLYDGSWTEYATKEGLIN